ncbi:HAD-IA family hydrolase [Candidatus Micrarchaeota archaeon]|nr:HAD-IA family hydrolase [Candidatus Micrarchaeota archaeon]
MPSKKIVFFDYGNVLAPVLGSSYLTNVSSASGLPKDVLSPIVFGEKRRELNKLESSARYWKDYSTRVSREIGSLRGKSFSEKQYYDAMKTGCGELNPHMLALARELKSKGVSVVVLSNITKPHAEFELFEKHSGTLPRYFDRVLASPWMGKRKPEARMFKHALRLSGGARPGEAALIDDKERNLRGMRRIGGHGFLYKIPETSDEEERERLLEKMDSALRRKLKRAGFL